MLVETCVGRLFVEVRGQGDPVVLWPSLLTDGGMWRFQVPALAERWRVIVIDPPGHGRSASIDRPFTLEDCADAAVEVMDALDAPRAHFAGLSWGGMTGMRLALRHPSRLRSLALLDTNADRETRSKVPSYRALVLLSRLLGHGVPLLLDRIEPLYFTRATRAERRDIVRDFRDQVTRMELSSVLHATDAVIFDRDDIRELLPSIRVPTLVMVGSDDKATPLARSLDIQRRIPGAALVELPNAAHLSALEAPERVTAELVRFFAAHE